MMWEWFPCPSSEPVHSAEAVMAKKLNQLENALGMLAVALVVMGVLTVSPRAWGDDPGGCSYCAEGTICVGGNCITACPDSTSVCGVQQNQTDCEPTPNIKCNNNNNCHCKWRIVNGGPAYGCICQNTTGL